MVVSPSQTRYFRFGGCGLYGGKWTPQGSAAYDTFEMPSDEVLDAWDQDEAAIGILKNFQQEGLKGTRQLGFRDVATLLEALGMEREQFVDVFTEDVSQEAEAIQDTIREWMSFKMSLKRGGMGDMDEDLEELLKYMEE